MWEKEINNPCEHRKFDYLWLGPFKIFEVIRKNNLKISTLEGNPFPILMNGKYLKKFYT